MFVFTLEYLTIGLVGHSPNFRVNFFSAVVRFFGVAHTMLSSRARCKSCIIFGSLGAV